MHLRTIIYPTAGPRRRRYVKHIDKNCLYCNCDISHNFCLKTFLMNRLSLMFILNTVPAQEEEEFEIFGRTYWDWIPLANARHLFIFLYSLWSVLWRFWEKTVRFFTIIYFEQRIQCIFNVVKVTTKIAVMSRHYWQSAISENTWTKNGKVLICCKGYIDFPRIFSQHMGTVTCCWK